MIAIVCVLLVFLSWTGLLKHVLDAISKAIGAIYDVFFPEDKRNGD